MSVCITVKTDKTLEPDTIFDYLLSKGEQIIITSEKFPSLKFGTIGKALRGIEINSEEEGYEIRICSFSSIADYQLFARCIDAVAFLSEGDIYLEDDEQKLDIPAVQYFDDKWIVRQWESDINVTRALVNASGSAVVLRGLFFMDICVGPYLFGAFDIPLYDDFSEEQHKELEDYLVSVQWFFKDKDDTSTMMVLSNPNDDKDEKTVSAILASKGEYKPFDYISNASLFCIHDGDGCPVLIPFKHLWKILPNGKFRRIDDYQFERIEDVTIEDIHGMKQIAKQLQPDDFFYEPVYPGCGFDESQNTVILMWNPQISSRKLDDHNSSIPYMLTEFYNWSVWEHDKAKCGDRFFLVRCGEGRTGIAISGVFISQPYELDDWSGRGRQTFYMDMMPNVILNPDTAPMLTTEQLQKEIPSFDWTGGHSGRLLTVEEARKLEKLWKEYISSVSDKVDHVNLNMTTMH
jgi:hypothetical protein